MVADYHTHTQGEDQEYVLAALDRGLDIPFMDSLQI